MGVRSARVHEDNSRHTLNQPSLRLEPTTYRYGTGTKPNTIATQCTHVHSHSCPHIEYTRVALGCILPPVWLVPTGVYLIKFLIGNLSYHGGIKGAAQRGENDLGLHFLLNFLYISLITEDCWHIVTT